MNKVLILEPSKSVRKSVAELMELEGFSVVAVEESSAAERAAVAAIASRKPFDLLLVDSSVAQMDGAVSALPFIVISLAPSIDEALSVARRGAVDYLTPPFDVNRLLGCVREVMQRPVEAVVESVAKPRVAAQALSYEMVGVSEQINSLRTLIDKIAPSDARVMILGENGTGKELVAHSIHEKSARRDHPFIEVNCAAIPSELIESELFGHEKGAFTSAIKQRRGKFEQANGGTLFLDEIGDMSLSAQAKVLRALQERKICRVGSDRDIDVDVRIIAATNKDLREEIRRGNFREDLYHRIGVIVVKVVALRDRVDDIPVLVDHFLHLICREYGMDCKEIAPEALQMLRGMRWSGNIRELRNVVERLVVLSNQRIESRDVECYC